MSCIFPLFIDFLFFLKNRAFFVCPGAETRDGAGGTSGMGLKEGRLGEWAPRSFLRNGGGGKR